MNLSLGLIWIDAIPYICAGAGALSLIVGLTYKKLFPVREEAPSDEAKSFSNRLAAHRRKRALENRRLDAELRERALEELEQEEHERAELEQEEQAAASAAEYEADEARLKNFDVFRSLLAEAQASPGDAEVDLAPAHRSTGGPLSRLLVDLSRDGSRDWTQALDELKELILLTEDLCDLLEIGRGEVAWRPEVRKAWDARLTTLAQLEEDLFQSSTSEDP